MDVNTKPVSRPNEDGNRGLTKAEMMDIMDGTVTAKSVFKEMLQNEQQAVDDKSDQPEAQTETETETQIETKVEDTSTKDKPETKVETKTDEKDQVDDTDPAVLRAELNFIKKQREQDQFELKAAQKLSQTRAGEIGYLKKQTSTVRAERPDDEVDFLADQDVAAHRRNEEPASVQDELRTMKELQKEQMKIEAARAYDEAAQKFLQLHPDLNTPEGAAKIKAHAERLFPVYANEINSGHPGKVAAHAPVFFENIALAVGTEIESEKLAEALKKKAEIKASTYAKQKQSAGADRGTSQVDNSKTYASETERAKNMPLEDLIKEVTGRPWTPPWGAKKK